MDMSLQMSSSLCQQKEKIKSNRIIIGYYNLRGKAQVCRLLCQYLNVDYCDKIFSLAEWQKFSNQRTKDWNFSSLPFLKEGSFIVTESVPMCTYIINRFGNMDLLGRTLQDRAIVDMYIWTIEYMGSIITINCQQKSPEQLAIFKQTQWIEKVYPRLLKLQEAVVGQRWFLDYLTIIDFSMYELIRYMDFIFTGKSLALKKLKRIEKELQNLPNIRKYESSPKAITEWCPMKLLEPLRLQNANRTKK